MSKLLLLRQLLLWGLVGAVVVLGVPVAIAHWGGFHAYALYLNVLVVLGLVCSLFIALTWTPYILRARLRGPLNVSWLSIIDFATLAYLGTFAFGLRMWITLQDGVVNPGGESRTILALLVWQIVGIKVVLRAYIWRRAMVRGSEALDDVTDHVQGPARIAAEETARSTPQHGNQRGN